MNIGENQKVYYDLNCTFNTFLEKVVLMEEKEQYRAICENKETIFAYASMLPNMAVLFSNSSYIDMAEKVKKVCTEGREKEYRELVVELAELTRQLITEKRNKFRKCPCCGNIVLYHPLADLYAENTLRHGGVMHISETLNRVEYMCPSCLSSDRDRMIISFMKSLELEKNSYGERLLQIAPARSIENWISDNCLSLRYDSTDLCMENVTFKTDIQDMKCVQAESYDYVICSHVLEHVENDMKAMQELYRILKNDGMIMFLVPVSLDIDEIDEEWGLSAEENRRRFGQDDHCRRYSREGLINRLKNAGFYVHCLGKSFFGEELFRECALTDTSTLYVLTKEEREIKEIVSDKVRKHNIVREDLPQVTVIMSTYNHGKFVEKAIQSVLNQTYKNIYFTVADDASVDNTVEVLLKYEDKIDEIHLYDENSGHGRGRELILNVNSKYIARMNSDDFWMPDKIEKQVAYMEAHPQCAACFTWCKECDEMGNELNMHIFREDNRNKEAWMNFFFWNGNCLAHPSVLIRTEIYQQLFLKNTSVLRQLPDFYNWIKIVQKDDIHIIKQNLVNFMFHSSATSINVSMPNIDNLMRMEQESTFIWYTIMKEMDSDYFKKAFASELINKDAETCEELACEKYFLMIRSQMLGVQTAAIYYYFDVFSDYRYYQVMRECYGYGNKEFFSDSLKIGFGAKIKELLK